MQQVAVRGVQLDDLEARGARAAHRLRGTPSCTVSKSPLSKARGAIQPASIGASVGATVRQALLAAVEVGLRERAVAVPRARHARLAPGMRELDCRHRTLALHEFSDSSQTWYVRVVPDADVAVRDAAALLHRGGLDEHDAGAALRELAEVHQVPVGDVAVLAPSTGTSAK